MDTQARSAAYIKTGASQITTDHETIRRWIEARDGSPAVVKSIHRAEEPGLLRVEFVGYRGSEWLEPMGWEAFFQYFDDAKLAFLYQERASDGTISRFYQFVSPN